MGARRRGLRERVAGLPPAAQVAADYAVERGARWVEDQGPPMLSLRPYVGADPARHGCVGAADFGGVVARLRAGGWTVFELRDTTSHNAYYFAEASDEPAD